MALLLAKGAYPVVEYDKTGPTASGKVNRSATRCRKKSGMASKKGYASTRFKLRTCIMVDIFRVKNPTEWNDKPRSTLHPPSGGTGLVDS